MTVLGFTAQNLSLSPLHCLDITKIMLNDQNISCCYVFIGITVTMWFQWVPTHKTDFWCEKKIKNKKKQNLSQISPITSFWAASGPSFQSVFSLTSSLRVISLTILADSIHNILIFFAEKMWVAFALQKLLTFFQQKISAYLPITLCKF